MRTVALVVISNEEYRKSIQIFQNERENYVGTLNDEEKYLLDESFYDKTMLNQICLKMVIEY